MEYYQLLQKFFFAEFIKDLLLAQQKEAISGLRLNPLKKTDLSFYSALIPHPIVPDAFLFNKKDYQFGKHPYHQAGAYYIQEPSAMLVGHLLNVLPDDKVADLCAAPGGKSTQVATKLSENGFLLSNDVNTKRALDLAENIERFGIKNCVVTNDSVEKISKLLPGYFDKVILDAPCSGEGMFRKNNLSKEDWSIEKVERLAILQKELILQAYSLLRKDGVLIYSTCTFNCYENEEVINYLLANTKASLLPLPTYPHIDRGINMEEAIRIFPNHFDGEGHFIALLKCNDEHPTIYTRRKNKSIDRKSLDIFHLFSKKNLNVHIPDDSLFINNNHLYSIPKNCIDTIKLHTLKSGLYLGELKETYFVPSHAFALASKASDWQRSINLPANSQELQAFLSGQTFPYTCLDGFTLIQCDGISIGFGKAVKNIVKNYYPKQLRK